MANRHLTAPALLAHVFLSHGSDTRAPARRLAAAWDRVTRHFGLDEEIPVLRVPSRLARDRIDPGESGLLAAAESGERSIWQACAWTGHGVLGITVMMAPPREHDCQEQWAALERRWEGALARIPDGDVLGEARLFLALLADRPGDGATRGPDVAASLARSAAPEPSAPGWWRRWDTVPVGQPDRDGAQDAILTWEIGPESSDGRSSRRLIALTSARSERLADRLLWTAGDGTPAPFTRHLAHAAGLRHQVSVYDGGAPARRLRDEIGQLVDDLPAVTAGSPSVATAVAMAGPPLLRARASAIALRRRLAAMRHAVAILGENLRQSSPSPAGVPASGPLADDLDLATWFQSRLDDEIALVNEAAQSAAAASAILADAGERASPALPAVLPDMPPDMPPGVLPLPRDRTRAPRVLPVRAPFPAGGGPSGSRARRVLVFTALGVEYQAIREYLDDTTRPHEVHGTVYEVGTLPGVRGNWLVATAETGPGSTAAGLQLDRAVRLFEPEIAIFLGVAGGRKDVTHGDVVAADAIYDYEWGKSTLAGFEPRIRTHQPAHRLLQWARLVARENRWQHRIRPACPDPPPVSHVKPIVTGGKVISHDRSEAAILVSRYAGDAVAVETEGHGFLAAAYVNPQVDALVIRGISDLLTGKDKRDDDYWQPVASRHAAAFAIEFLDNIGANET